MTNLKVHVSDLTRPLLAYGGRQPCVFLPTNFDVRVVRLALRNHGRRVPLPSEDQRRHGVHAEVHGAEPFLFRGQT